MTTVTFTPFYKKLCFNLVSLTLIILLLYIGQGILVPIFFAVLLSTLLLPGVQFLNQKLHLNNLLSITIALLIAFFFIISLIYFLTSQSINFFDDLPTIKERLNSLAMSIKEWVYHHFNIAIRKQDQYIKETTHNMQTTTPGGIIGQTFLSLTEALSYLILLPIYSFLILYYRDLIRKVLISLFKNSHESKVCEIIQESCLVSQMYIIGLMIEMLIVFSLNAAGFLILGIKYGLFLALIAALLNLVPYVGMLVASLFCMLTTLVSCNSINDMFWVGVVLGVVQIIDNNFLMPVVVGSKVKVNAMATIVGVLVGGALCGFSGMFLSIPGLAVLKVIFDRVDELKPFGMLIGGDHDNSTKPAKQEVIGL